MQSNYTDDLLDAFTANAEHIACHTYGVKSSRIDAWQAFRCKKLLSNLPIVKLDAAIGQLDARG